MGQISASEIQRHSHIWQGKQRRNISFAKRADLLEFVGEEQRSSRGLSISTLKSTGSLACKCRYKLIVAQLACLFSAALLLLLLGTAVEATIVHRSLHLREHAP